MKETILEVIKLSNEDVITTSGMIAGNWSATSYQTYTSSMLDCGEGICSNSQDKLGYLTDTNYYNYLDGTGNNDSDGDIFESGKYYHYDEDFDLGFFSGFPTYSHWKECNEENCGSDYMIHRGY